MSMANLSKNTMVYLLGNILNRLGAFVLLPLYTNYLSVSEFGALEIIYTINSVLSLLFGAGLAHATLRFYFESSDERYRHSIVFTNIIVSLGLSVLGSSIVALFSEGISQWLFDEAKSSIIYIALVIIVLELSNEVMLAYLRALEKAKLFVVLSLIRLVVQVSVSVWLVGFLDMSVTGVLIANLAAIGCIWLYLLFFTLRYTGFSIDSSLITPILKYSIPFAASGILGTLVATLDKVLLKEFSGVAQVGVYALATKFSLLISFLVMEPFSRGYGPYRFKIMNDESAPRVNANIAYYLVIIAGFCALGISLFTPVVIRLMSDESYFESGSIVPVLVFGFLLAGVNYVFQTGILVMKQTKKVLSASSLNAVSTVVLYFLLIPSLGIWGAAIGFVISNFLLAIITLYYSQKVYPIPFKLGQMTGVLFLAGVLGATSFLLDAQSPIWTSLINLLLLILYFLLIFIFDKSVKEDLSKGVDYIRTFLNKER